MGDHVGFAVRDASTLPLESTDASRLTSFTPLRSKPAGRTPRCSESLPCHDHCRSVAPRGVSLRLPLFPRGGRHAGVTARGVTQQRLC